MLAHRGPGEEVEVAEAGHDEERRGEQRVQPPHHAPGQLRLERAVEGVRGQGAGRRLQRDPEEVEDGPDEDEVERAVPHVHEGEADGAAEQLEDEARGQGGDDGEVDVAETGKGSE